MQSITFRTRNERKIDVKENLGNFIKFLEVFGEHDEKLRMHLSSPTMKNITYLFPEIQNELISIKGKDLILNGINSEIKGSKFFSIMAHEETLHNNEEYAFCIIFIDGDNHLGDDFIDFISLIRITGEAVATALRQTLEKIGSDIANMTGQGCSSVSDNAVGVQAIIKKDSPKALVQATG